LCYPVRHPDGKFVSVVNRFRIEAPRNHNLGLLSLHTSDLT